MWRALFVLHIVPIKCFYLIRGQAGINSFICPPLSDGRTERIWSYFFPNCPPVPLGEQSRMTDGYNSRLNARQYHAGNADPLSQIGAYIFWVLEKLRYSHVKVTLDCVEIYYANDFLEIIVYLTVNSSKFSRTNNEENFCACFSSGLLLCLPQ